MLWVFASFVIGGLICKIKKINCPFNLIGDTLSSSNKKLKNNFPKSAKMCFIYQVECWKAATKSLYNVLG
jgi:hypothetical protein